MTLSQLFLYVIYADAAIVLIAGFTAAILILLGKDMKQFWSRIAPATGTLVGTTLAAAAILAVGRWLFVS